MLSKTIHSVYISGPMTGYEYLNFPAFRDAAVDLRKRYKGRGLVVYSPAEMDVDDGIRPAKHNAFAYTPEYIKLLARDIRLIASGEVDAIVCLRGYENSRGACAEVTVARLLEIPVFRYPELTLIGG